MKILVPVTIELPVSVLLYFAGLAEKGHVTHKQAMSAVLTGFVECQAEGLMQPLDLSPFIGIDTKPSPHQNN